MIINGFDLLKAAPIKDMESKKVVVHGMSYGLSEAGYDIRIKQGVIFKPYCVLTENREHPWIRGTVATNWHESAANSWVANTGQFTLASAVEEFQMPDYLVGRVCDKSSWARKGLSVFNTVIEPGFIGGLTLELVYHGSTELIIPAGAPIAQVLFEEVKNPARYKGKYQFQSTDPTPSRYQNAGNGASES